MTTPTRTTQPIWNDRCTCGHIAVAHGVGNGWNLRGACLRRCGCKRFERAGVAS